MSNRPPSHNPPSLMRNILNKAVTVTLRMQNIYLTGTLRSYDTYSNIVLSDVVEFEKTPEGAKELRKIEGQVFIKGDSVIHIVF